MPADSGFVSQGQLVGKAMFFVFYSFATNQIDRTDWRRPILFLSSTAEFLFFSDRDGAQKMMLSLSRKHVLSEDSGEGLVLPMS